MDIRVLIDKFMDGKTSLEEERILGDYFRTEKNIPEDMQPYRDMFAYFDGGMTDDQGGIAAASSGWGVMRIVRRMLAVAASVAVLLAVAYRIAAYDAGVTANGGNAPRTARGTVAQATAPRPSVADTVATAPDSMRSAGGERNSRTPERRTPRKYRYKLAPPKAFLASARSAAISDSIGRAASRLAEAELRKVEYEQQYVLTLINAVDMIHSADIAAARDEEEAY